VWIITSENSSALIGAFEKYTPLLVTVIGPVKQTLLPAKD